MLVLFICTEAVESSEYGLPLLYHYSNCTYHNRSSLRVYIINMQDYEVHVDVQLIRGHDHGLAMDLPILLEKVTKIPILLPDKLARRKYQCLRYHCGGEGTKICGENIDLHRGTDIEKVTGVTISTRPNDPTILTSVVTREKGFVNVLSLMSLTKRAHYAYYIMHGRRRGQYDVPTVGLLQPNDLNVTINITLKENDTLVYKNLVLVEEGSEWTQLAERGTVWLQYKKPSLFKIESLHPLSVFTGFATSNSTYFSHHVRHAQQMPDTSQWGTVFIADLTVIEKYENAMVSLSILTSNSTTIHITTQQDTRHYKMEAESIKIITIQRSKQTSSYINIKSSQKLLILYEAYRESADQNNTIFSTYLQPTEWHTYKQAVIIVPSLINTNQPYIIAILAPQKSSIYVSTSTTAPVQLPNYENLMLLRTVDVTSYTLYTLTHHTLGEEEEVLLFTANDTRNCSVTLGVTFYTPHYAHTNPPPLGTHTHTHNHL